MLKSIEGVIRNGKVELLEPAPSEEGARVVVTFIPSRNEVDLAARGITPQQASDLRARLKSFESDWNRPEMEIYDET
jgi:hypothetical protein